MKKSFGILAIILTSLAYGTGVRAFEPIDYGYHSLVPADHINMDAPNTGAVADYPEASGGTLVAPDPWAASGTLVPGGHINMDAPTIVSPEIGTTGPSVAAPAPAAVESDPDGIIRSANAADSEVAGEPTTVRAQGGCTLTAPLVYGFGNLMYALLTLIPTLTFLGLRKK